MSQLVGTTVKNVVIIIIMTWCSGSVHSYTYVLCSYIYTQCPYQCSYSYNASFVIVIKPEVKIMHWHIFPGSVVHHFITLNEVVQVLLSLHRYTPTMLLLSCMMLVAPVAWCLDQALWNLITDSQNSKQHNAVISLLSKCAQSIKWNFCPSICMDITI